MIQSPVNLVGNRVQSVWTRIIRSRRITMQGRSHLSGLLARLLKRPLILNHNPIKGARLTALGITQVETYA